jgi:hypothetical protein
MGKIKIRIWDEHPRLESIFRVKHFNSLILMWIRTRDPGIFFDPGSGIRDGKIRIRDKHLGSANADLDFEYLK